MADYFGTDTVVSELRDDGQSEPRHYGTNGALSAAARRSA